MKNKSFVLLIFLFISSCNLYDLAGDNTDFSNQFDKIVEDQVVLLSPSHHYFGHVASSATVTINIKNVTDQAIDNISFTTMTDPGYTSGASSCGGVLASGSSCSVDVTLTPLGAGHHHGNLHISIEQPAGTFHDVWANFDGYQ